MAFSGGFGASPITSSGGFGAAATPGGFGAAPGGFASPATGGAFGASAATPGGSMFGQPAAGGGFGAAKPFGSTGVTGFGAPSTATTGGFGQPAATGGFGVGAQQQQGSSQPMKIMNHNREDYEVPTPFQDHDSISSVCWGPNGLLASAGWDKRVCVYQVQHQKSSWSSSINASIKAFITHGGPVLDVSFKNDGTGCFSAGSDGVVKWWQFNPSGGQQQQGQDIGRHNGPVKACRWIPEVNMVATAGFDKMLKYWDVRSPNPALQVQLPERCYAMDARHPYLIVALGASGNTAVDRKVIAYNLQNPQQPFYQMDTMKNPLKFQNRCISLLPDKSGFALGTIEGRVTVQYFNPSVKPLTFKCHRDKTKKWIYSVNSIAFHTKYLTFSTAGADGYYNFWDKDSKTRLKQSAKVLYGPPAASVSNSNGTQPASITSSQFDPSGELFAYSVGYDWTKGMPPNFNPAAIKSSIYIRPVKDADIKPKR